MTRHGLIAYCLSLPGVYEDYPFGGFPGQADAWTAMRHRANNKTFAFIYERDGLCVNLKCEPLRADLLRQLFAGVTPAYHMNKQHWNTVRPDSDVPEKELRAQIRHSYELTAPKKQAAGRKA